MFLLTGTIIWCFALPRQKYLSTDIFSQLAIPYTIGNWQGRDMEQEWNSEDSKYNFISQCMDREYVHGENNIFLIILNAGNFHNPKVCFSSAGYEVKEVGNISFSVANRTFPICRIHAKKGSDSYLICYWMCIDKNMVNWTGQKIKELYYTLINKDRIGLMIRLDVPCNEENIGEASMVAKMFAEDLCQSMPMTQAEYLFGRKL